MNVNWQLEEICSKITAIFVPAFKESTISKIVGRLFARKFQQLRSVSSDFDQQGKFKNELYIEGPTKWKVTGKTEYHHWLVRIF